MALSSWKVATKWPSPIYNRSLNCCAFDKHYCVITHFLFYYENASICLFSWYINPIWWSLTCTRIILDIVVSERKSAFLPGSYSSASITAAAIHTDNDAACNKSYQNCSILCHCYRLWSMFEPYCRLYDRLTLDGCNCQVSLVHIVHKLWAHPLLPVDGLFVFYWRAENSPMFSLGNLADRFTSTYPTSHDMWQVPLKFFGVCKPGPLS